MSQELKLLPCRLCKSTPTIYGSKFCPTVLCPCGAGAGCVEDWNFLHSPLMWTTEPPTVPGNYWWKCEQEQPDVPQMVNATITDGQFHFFFHYSEGPCLHECDKCLWAGPIPTPQEPTP